MSASIQCKQCNGSTARSRSSSVPLLWAAYALASALTWWMVLDAGIAPVFSAVFAALVMWGAIRWWRASERCSGRPVAAYRFECESCRATSESPMPPVAQALSVAGAALLLVAMGWFAVLRWAGSVVVGVLGAVGRRSERPRAANDRFDYEPYQQQDDPSPEPGTADSEPWQDWVPPEYYEKPAGKGAGEYKPGAWGNLGEPKPGAWGNLGEPRPGASGNLGQHRPGAWGSLG